MTLEQLLRDAPADWVICTGTGATKNMVLSAVMDGARDFDAVARSVELCRENVCAASNSSGRGCRENVETLLKIYVPIYDLIFEGGGCHHKHGRHENKSCAAEDCKSCGSCKE